MRIIVGVTGATGVEMSYCLLKALKRVEECKTHLVISEGAKTTWELESSIPMEKLLYMAASISSMKTLAGIAVGYAQNLIVRGDTPHMGSAVMPVARFGLTGAGIGATFSVLTGIGHKDDVIARMFAEGIAKKRNCTVVCSCGIHRMYSSV